MLQYKNGRLYGNGVSFEIPEGFFIEPNPGVALMDGIMLFSPDKKFWVQYEFQKMESAHDGLHVLLSDFEGTVLNPITPLEINGLNGYCASYLDGTYSYYEARFDILPEDSEHTTFLFIIGVRRFALDEILSSPEYQRALHSFRKE